MLGGNSLVIGGTGAPTFHKAFLYYDHQVLVSAKLSYQISGYIMDQNGAASPYFCIILKVKVKLHTYTAPLEVYGHLICRMLYITSLAGLLHQTLV